MLPPPGLGVPISPPGVGVHFHQWDIHRCLGKVPDKDTPAIGTLVCHHPVKPKPFEQGSNTRPACLVFRPPLGTWAELESCAGGRSALIQIHFAAPHQRGTPDTPWGWGMICDSSKECSSLGSACLSACPPWGTRCPW